MNRPDWLYDLEARGGQVEGNVLEAWTDAAREAAAAARKADTAVEEPKPNSHMYRPPGQFDNDYHHVISTSGGPLHPNVIEHHLSKLKPGSKVSVVYTATTGKGDEEQGKQMEGTVTRVGKGLAGRKAAVINATKGDFGTGEKGIHSVSGIHALTYKL